VTDYRPGDTRPRRSGAGSQLIEDVATYFPGREIRVKPYPIDEDGTQTTEDLDEFYAGRGFDRYRLKDGDPFELYDHMTRPASSRPTAVPEANWSALGEAVGAMREASHHPAAALPEHKAREGAEVRDTRPAVAAESFPLAPAAGLPPRNSSATSSGQSAHNTPRARPPQSQPATRGRGQR
jgi:hypothetical protein